MKYSFRKNRCMVKENSEMAKIWPFVTKNWPFLAKIDNFELFGSPDVFRLRKEPINSVPYVRASVRASVPVLQP